MTRPMPGPPVCTCDWDRANPTIPTWRRLPDPDCTHPDHMEKVDLAHEVLDLIKPDGEGGFDYPNEWNFERAAWIAPALARAVLDMREELVAGEASDGYHTHNELYEYRTLYNAHAAQAWTAAGYNVSKSWNHADGEACFGGGWFIVSAQLPTGQVSNHYPATDWDLFHIPAVDLAPEWDGHTPAEAAQRLRDALNNND